MRYVVLPILCLSLMLLTSSPATLQERQNSHSAISGGNENFLTSTQSASGAWSGSARDTAAVIEALREAGQGGSALAPAYAWLAGRPGDSTAEQAYAAMALAGRGDAAALATALLAGQNIGVLGSGEAAPIYADSFEAATGDWRRGGLAICRDPEYVEGELRVVSARHPFNPDCWMYTTPVLSDLDIQVEARKDVTRPATSYGIVFRAQPGANTFGRDNSFYSFEIDPAAGTYYLGLQIGETETPLVGWTPSVAIQRDDVANLLRVTAEGTTIKAYVNDTLLATVTDGALSAGGVGLIVRTLDEALTPFSARFDDLAIYRSRAFSSVRPNGADGGWGAAPGYASDTLHTALALSALRAAGISGPGVPRGIAYLVAAQNTDGGWGLARSGPSTPVLTAHALIALAGHSSAEGVAAAVQRGTAYLGARQNGDGGWGLQGSTVIESTLALRALKLIGASANTAGINYLKNAQQANGSWNNSPYDTALAMMVLGERRLYLPLVRR